jgi:hypothetical protein
MGKRKVGAVRDLHPAARKRVHFSSKPPEVQSFRCEGSKGNELKKRKPRTASSKKGEAFFKSAIASRDHDTAQSVSATKDTSVNLFPDRDIMWLERARTLMILSCMAEGTQKGYRSGWNTWELFTRCRGTSPWLTAEEAKGIREEEE